MLDLCYRWIPLKYVHRKRKLHRWQPRAVRLMPTSLTQYATTKQNPVLAEFVTQQRFAAVREFTRPITRSLRYVTRQRILCLDTALCSFFGKRYVFFLFFRIFISLLACIYVRVFLVLYAREISTLALHTLVYINNMHRVFLFTEVFLFQKFRNSFTVFGDFIFLEKRNFRIQNLEFSYSFLWINIHIFFFFFWKREILEFRIQKIFNLKIPQS